MADGGGTGGDGGHEQAGFMPPHERFELPKAREEFIEESGTYALECGEDRIPSERIRGILIAYESHLAERGLLKGHEPDVHY